MKQSQKNSYLKVPIASLLLSNCLVTANFYPRLDVMPMEEFFTEKGENWRTLNCWECFEAQGKMCHDEDYTSMTQVTNSRDSGDQVCCRSGFSGDHCNNDDDHVCSEPAHTDDQSSAYWNVLSPGNLNHQMFAFCTQTTQKTCGISDSDSTDMSIKADTSSKKISSNEMYYLKGHPSVRQYDSCFYEISIADLTDEERSQLLSGDNNAISINLQVTKASQMNVYLYGGSDRFSATLPVVENNDQVSLGQTYKVDSNTGFLLVAYPNMDVETEFEFTYTLEGYYQVMVSGGQPGDLPQVAHSEDVHIEMAQDLLLTSDSEKDQTVIQDLTEVAQENQSYTIAFGVVCLILIFSMIACFVMRRNKIRVDTTTLVDEGVEISGENIGTDSPRAPAHESSDRLESVENDDEKVGLSPSKVGLSKSKQKSNHDSVLQSDRSDMEAREGGEKLDLGIKNNRVSCLLPPIHLKGSATTHKYVANSNEFTFDITKRKDGSGVASGSKFE